MNLYAINGKYQEILNNLYDDNGEINQEALIKLEHNEAALQEKAIAIASFIKNMDAEREAIAAAKQAMAEREKRYKKRSEELMGYLMFNMQKRDITSVKCPYFEVKVKKCPVSVDDDSIDMDALPDEYKRTKVEVKPDKVKILQEMKLGVIVPGIRLKQNMKLEII